MTESKTKGTVGPPLLACPLRPLVSFLYFILYFKNMTRAIHGDLRDERVWWE